MIKQASDECPKVLALVYKGVPTPGVVSRGGRGVPGGSSGPEHRRGCGCLGLGRFLRLSCTPQSCSHTVARSAMGGYAAVCGGRLWSPDLGPASLRS